MHVQPWNANGSITTGHSSEISCSFISLEHVSFITLRCHTISSSPQMKPWFASITLRSEARIFCARRAITCGSLLTCGRVKRRNALPLTSVNGDTVGRPHATTSDETSWSLQLNRPCSWMSLLGVTSSMQPMVSVTGSVTKWSCNTHAPNWSKTTTLPLHVLGLIFSSAEITSFTLVWYGTWTTTGGSSECVHNVTSIKSVTTVGAIDVGLLCSSSLSDTQSDNCEGMAICVEARSQVADFNSSTLKPFVVATPNSEQMLSMFSAHCSMLRSGRT